MHLQACIALRHWAKEEGIQHPLKRRWRPLEDCGMALQKVQTGKKHKNQLTETARCICSKVLSNVFFVCVFDGFWTSLKIAAPNSTLVSGSCSSNSDPKALDCEVTHIQSVWTVSVFSGLIRLIVPRGQIKLQNTILHPTAMQKKMFEHGLESWRGSKERLSCFVKWRIVCQCLKGWRRSAVNFSIGSSLKLKCADISGRLFKIYVYIQGTCCCLVPFKINMYHVVWIWLRLFINTQTIAVLLTCSKWLEKLSRWLRKDFQAILVHSMKIGSVCDTQHLVLGSSHESEVVKHIHLYMGWFSKYFLLFRKKLKPD